MNILLINHYAGSISYGMEYRPFYLAQEWIKDGHQVEILAASYSHIRTEQPQMDDVTQNEVIDDVIYRWYQTPGYSGNGVGRVKNIMVFLWGIWRDSKSLADEFKPDIVIASSTYPMDIWPARLIAKRANAKLVYEVHDLWPLSPVELGAMSRWHPFIIWCQWAEDYAYRYSDKVISILPKTQEHMVSRGMRPEKFGYIPNGVNIEEWDMNEALPDNITKELVSVRQRGLPIVGYAGTYGLANALDVLLDAAKLAADKFEVIMVGKGPEQERLSKRIAEERIDNVTLLGAIPKASIPAFLSEIDIAFIGWHENSLYRFGISPNKLMDYMMAGKPILHSVNAGNDPVAEAGCGLTVAAGDSKAIRDGIVRLMGYSNEERLELGEKGRCFVLAERNYSTLAKQFIDMIGDIKHL